MNYYPDRDGDLAGWDGSTTSSTLVQRHLAGSQVVKAFNNIDFVRLFSLARPAGARDRSALPIAGDDAAAKAQAARLLDVLGYDAVDIGSLIDSWRSQPGTRSTCSLTTRPTAPGSAARKPGPPSSPHPGSPLPPTG